jgi:hypothetical protein
MKAFRRRFEEAREDGSHRVKVTLNHHQSLRFRVAV